MILTATDNTSWWVAPHWHEHMRMVVSTAHWSKHIADSRRVALWTHALCETEDWACALKERVLDETDANGTAFIHRCISDTNHAHQISGAFKGFRWACPDDAMPQGLKKHEPLLTTTGHLINLGDDRLETQPPSQQMWTRYSMTHLMMKYPPGLVDGNKWCDNKVETRDVHCALKPIHSSQRRTHIVTSVSKVAWMTIT